MLILGEVHTGLLQNSTSLSSTRCDQVLGLFRGEAVRQFARPIAHAASPELLTGVDCRLATSSGAKVRGIGTVTHHATITGGHVVQGSAVACVTAAVTGRRLPWSHYLARPGQVEMLGTAEWADLAQGFLAGRSTASALDLGAISGRLVDTIQSSLELDRHPPLRTARTALRWVATTAAPVTGEPVTFGIETGQLRTLRLRCSDDQVAAVPALCEDLALHDWLLTTMLEVIERSRIGDQPLGRVVERLRPAIDHLLHLWMPAARVRQDLLELWESLERRPGFTRQWQASVDRIRDQIAVGTITLLGAGLGRDTGHAQRSAPSSGFATPRRPL